LGRAEGPRGFGKNLNVNYKAAAPSLLAVYVGYNPDYLECQERQLCAPAIADPLDVEQNGSPRDEPIRSLRLSNTAPAMTSATVSELTYTLMDRSGA
jgi:hypothetical protein